MCLCVEFIRDRCFNFFLGLRWYSLELFGGVSIERLFRLYWFISMFVNFFDCWWVELFKDIVDSVIFSYMVLDCVRNNWIWVSVGINK